MNAKIPIIDVAEAAKNSHEKADLYVSREKIYVRKITGFFQRVRKFSLSLLLVMYFAFAWINLDGAPLILFDLGEQKFHLFGAIFWPQDLALLAFALIISAFGLFFMTSLFGRVWCGYSCPQTVWSLMFIWLEEFFEGGRNQRIKLDKSPNDIAKISRKVAKHFSWLLLALATAITFVGYFYPIRELSVQLITLSLDNGWVWFWIFFFTSATYINAGWLREQVCIYMCPYARFQSVMFNENTLIVGYDEKRGEPRRRGTRKLQKNEALGDCVDCQLCVQVCPVGIDIRDGLQYECIGCALCIDACDNIMTKLNKDVGLIRYASEKEFQQGSSRKTFDARAFGYGVALLAAVGIFTFLMISRPQAELSALRDRGALYTENGQGMIENFYTLKLVNKRETSDVFTLSIDGEHSFVSSNTSLSIGPGEVKNFPVSISVDPEKISNSKSEIVFEVQSESRPIVFAAAKSKFLGPTYRLD